MKARTLPNHVRVRLLREGERLAREQGIDRLLGDGFRVLVRFDPESRKVVYSFRAMDDLSSDGPEAGWMHLR